MKIALFSKPFYPSVGGVQVTTRTMARAFVELGHDVTVLTSTQADGHPELQEGYRVVRSTSMPTLVGHFRGADLVVSKGGVSSVAGLGAILAIRPLVILHEMSGLYRSRGSGLRDRMSNLFKEMVCRYAALHIGVSKACLESKELHPHALKRVIYNAVDSKHVGSPAALPQSVDAKSDYDVLFVGRVIQAKGVFVLAAALQRFEDAQYPLVVAFVGRGKDEERARQIVAPWRHVRVVFRGVLIGTELAQAYRRSKIVVVPSTTHPEGMNLVAAEALAFGRPVIGSDQPAIREIIGDGGRIFRNGDVRDLYETIRLLVNDDTALEKVSLRARARADLFSEATFRVKLSEAIRLVAVSP